MSLLKRNHIVRVGGQDVTSRFAPLLLDLTVNRSAGKAADIANIRLANPGGMVIMPSDRAPMEIILGGHWAFEGFVSEVECSVDKSSGRTMMISASSVDQGGEATAPKLQHLDEADLRTVAQKFGSTAGLNVQVLGSIAEIKRDYWLQQNESFIAWGQRIADEVGATFKVLGSRAFFAGRNEGLSASGKTLTPIAATYGVNLISANIRPIVSQPRFKDVKISYFDRLKGERVEESSDTGIDGVATTLRYLLGSATKEQAQRVAEAKGKEADREKGQGTVTIIGDARAEPEAICTTSGVATGADGSYRIDAASLRLSKKSGFTTTVTLRQPQDGAGVDSR
ncbi:phage late control D family protein [Roseibium alexandrii]|uniref:phage late control D family protein n=1 Tax=Roseibium alexandrii TaxID=388408 RepID=UPI0037516EB2